MRKLLNRAFVAIKGLAKKESAYRPQRRRRLEIEGLEERQLLSVSGLALLTPIQAEYAATAGETDAYGNNVQRLLGAATSGEISVPGVAGARMETFQHGSIYYSWGTGGANVVYGDVAVRYRAVGGPASFGLPVSDEAAVPAVPGLRVTNFQGGRSIYWSGATGAHAVTGLIRDEYLATADETDASGNAVQGILGAPTSDDKQVPATPGAYMNTFQGGTIYWSQPTGAHAVYGAIAAKYASPGESSSLLGLPNSEERQDDNGVREQYFEYGKILSVPQGALVIPATSSMTFDSGYIGFSDGTPVGGSVQLTVFQNGTFEIKGSFHNSGFWPEDVKGVVDLVSPSGRVWTQPFSTSMAGTIGSGSRDGTFDVYDKDSTLTDNWADFEGGMMHTTTKVGVDWGSVWDAVKPYAATAGAAAFAWLCKKTSDGSSGSGSSTMSFAVKTYAVALDASALGVPTVSVDGVPYDATAPFSTKLLPGAHTLTADGTDVTAFAVHLDGTVSYDPSLEGALTGNGTAALAVHGFAVALDPTALGVAGLALDNMPLDGAAASSVNLLPGQHTLTTNGTDVTAFTVNPDGTVSYDPSLEGALTGSGTTALAINGYAVALDATALGVASLYADGVAHDATASFNVNLLPGQHSLTSNGTDVISFTVNADGTISYDPSLEGALTGSGTTSLGVIGRAVTLDASARGVASMALDGVDHDATAPFSINLLPGQHSLSTDGTDVLWLTVNQDGTVTYDPALEGILTGSGTTGLVWQTP